MRLIIMPLYGIGDVLMTTPAVRNLKERLNAHITYLHMFRATYDVLVNNPYIDEQILFPFLSEGRLSSFRFLLSLRGRFDASINFYPSNRKDYNLASFLVGCPIRIGHRYKIRDWAELNFLKNKTIMEDDALHNVEEDLRLLEFLGIKDPTPYPLEIYLTEKERGFAGLWLKKNSLAGRTLIGFHPGSSVFKEHAKKRWPSEKYSSLIDRLSKEGDFHFLLFGGKEERNIKDEIKERTSVRDRVIAVETDSIRETASIMEACRVFITNDSGLMHLSAALQLPTVAIFGPTNPRWLAPWRCPHRVIRLSVDCDPCFRYSPLPQRCIKERGFSCVRDIDVEEVLEAALGLLR